MQEFDVLDLSGEDLDYDEASTMDIPCASGSMPCCTSCVRCSGSTRCS